MTITLSDGCTYELKDTKEIVHIYKDNQKGTFWYCKETRNGFEVDRRYITVTEEDFSRQVFMSYAEIMEIKEGDIVVYLSGGYNTAPHLDIGQVVGFKKARVCVKFSDTDKVSNIASHKLMVVTEARLREKYNWIK